MRNAASPVRSRLGTTRSSPSRSPSRSTYTPPARRISSSPVRTSSRTTDWTEDGSRVRLALSWSASGVRSHPRLAWRSQSVAGIGKLEFESRASPTKLSTPSRAVVSGGVMERALVLDSSPDEASRRSLTNVSWHGASRNSKYHIDVEALARQAASAVHSTEEAQRCNRPPRINERLCTENTTSVPSVLALFEGHILARDLGNPPREP